MMASGKHWGRWGSLGVAVFRALPRCKRREGLNTSLPRARRRPLSFPFCAVQVTRVTLRNAPAFAARLGVTVEVPGGVGPVMLDLAYGGMW